VCPTLEVKMYLASLCFKKDTKILEDVLISGMWELSYPTRLPKLNLSTLVYRRNRGDVILTYNLTRANTLPALFPSVGPNSRTISHI